MRIWPLWLLLIATLAGCSADEAPPEPVQALPGIGNLRGLVVDDAVTPLQGARVIIKDTGLETVTGVDGTFGVDNLVEGPYRLRITKLEHDPVEVTAHIKAGEVDPEVVRIQMTRIPGTAPLAVPATHNGWIGCEALVLYILQNCDGDAGAFGPADNHILLTQPEGVPAAVHVEVAWEAGQDFAKSLTLTFGTCNGVDYCDPQPPSDTYMCSAWGQSPTWCRVNQTGVERNGDGIGHRNIRDAEHGVRALPGLAVHVGADCTNCLVPPYQTWGVGLAIQQEIQVFTWSFFNFEPESGWGFVQDGEPIPQ